jgi:hypothetical protein
MYHEIHVSSVNPSDMRHDIWRGWNELPAPKHRVMVVAKTLRYNGAGKNPTLLGIAPVDPARSNVTRVLQVLVAGEGRLSM